MEILIIGAIVVALMVWASTKIKRSAAAAFEEEMIETGEFTLAKPEGFLSQIEPPDFLAVYAYSKEFGDDENTEKIRQGLIKLKILAGRKLAEIVKEKKSAFEQILSEEKPDQSTVLLTGTRVEKDVETIFYHKFVGAGEKIFDLEMAVLADYREKYEEKAEKLLASFRVK